MRVWICTMTTVLAIGAMVSAQSSDVTIRVPLNLTQLAPDISRVRVICTVRSPVVRSSSNILVDEALIAAPAGARYVVVSGGQAVATLDVAVPIPASSFTGPAVGQNATWECALTGFSTSGNRWDAFNATHANPAFRLSPTPGAITGNFTW